MWSALLSICANLFHYLPDVKCINALYVDEKSFIGDEYVFHVDQGLRAPPTPTF